MTLCLDSIVLFENHPSSTRDYRNGPFVILYKSIEVR